MKIISKLDIDNLESEILRLNLLEKQMLQAWEVELSRGFASMNQIHDTIAE